MEVKFRIDVTNVNATNADILIEDISVCRYFPTSEIQGGWKLRVWIFGSRGCIDERKPPVLRGGYVRTQQ